MPMYPDTVKAVLASRRLGIEDSEIKEILDLVRQHVGVE